MRLCPLLIDGFTSLPLGRPFLSSSRLTAWLGHGMGGGHPRLVPLGKRPVSPFSMVVAEGLSLVPFIRGSSFLFLLCFLFLTLREY